MSDPKKPMELPPVKHVWTGNSGGLYCITTVAYMASSRMQGYADGPQVRREIERCNAHTLYRSIYEDRSKEFFDLAYHLLNIWTPGWGPYEEVRAVVEKMATLSHFLPPAAIESVFRKGPDE